MIADDDGYIFCFDNQTIIDEADVPLTEDDAEEVAYEMEARFEAWIRDVARDYMKGKHNG